MTTERIEIVISESGSRTVRRNIEDIGQSASKAQGTVSLLNRALGAIASLSAAIAVGKMADEYQNLQNRLRLVTSTTDELVAVQQSLVSVSQETRTSLEGNVILFSRMATATGSLHLNFKQLLDMTRTVDQAIKISGATTVEATAAIIQFSQGLASGALRGQDLHSVVEQLPALANIIGKEFGVAGGQLQAFANNNPNIVTTTRIVHALAAAAEETGQKFGKIIPTIGDAFTRLHTALTVYVGGLSQSLGTAKLFNQAVDLIIANLDKLALVILGLGALTVFNVMTTQVLGLGKTILSVLELLSGGFINLGRIILAFVVAPLQLLGAVFALNPLVLTGVAVIAAIAGAFFLFGDQIKAVIAKLGGLTGVANTTVSALLAAGKTIIDNWRLIPRALGDLTIQGLNAVLKAIHDFFANWKQILINLGKSTIELAGRIGSGISDIVTAAFTKGASIKDAISKALADGTTTSKDGLTQINNVFEGSAAQIGKSFDDNLQESLKAQPVTAFVDTVKGKFTDLQDFMQSFTKSALSPEQIAKLLGGTPSVPAGSNVLQNKEHRGPKGFKDYIFDLTNENKLLQMSTFQREALAKEMQIEDALRRHLTVSEKAQVEALLLENQRLKDQNDVYEEIKGPQETFARKVDAINALLSHGKISIGEYNDKLREMKIASLETARDMSSGIERGLLKIQDEFGNVAKTAEEVMVNSFKSISDAITELVTTGKTDFKSLIDSIFKDITRLAVQQSITQPLSQMLGIGAGGASSAGGFLGGLLSPNGQSGFNLGGLFSGIGSALGFENGGNFTVGGSGGPDSQLVAFRATPGEDVHVRPKGQATSGEKPVMINFNIQTPDAASFARSQGQLMAKASAALTRANKRNN